MKENQVEIKVQLNRIIVENLKLNKNLKNEIEIKENEKHDFFKDLAINIIDIIDSMENIDEWIIVYDENKIEYIISQKDNGLYNAINKAISLSTGELILILNSDDWYEDNAVETLYKVKSKLNVNYTFELLIRIVQVIYILYYLMIFLNLSKVYKIVVLLFQNHKISLTMMD